MSDSPVAAFSVYRKHSITIKQKRAKSKKKKTKSPFAIANTIKDISENGDVINKLTRKMNRQGKKSKKNRLKLAQGINQKVFQKSAIKIPKRCVELQLSSTISKARKSVEFPSNELSPQSSSLSSPTSSITSPKAAQSRHPQQAFEWMMAPLGSSTFFKLHWEKGPLYIKRSLPNYYKQILTTEKLDAILRENVLFYTRNVDVVSYVDGKRETHNPEGRAMAAALWDYYENGCSIRILNPQTYCKKLHALLDALQEYFGCMAGANAYLTPPGSQGFAPHYDDIEAFVLQLEGRKHWKLYAPLNENETLPRFSSKNFDPSELQEPIKEVTLEAGDILYFPRGVIHEGRTDADSHSFHITVSVYQRTAYVDLMEHILKPALAAAAQNDIEFREGLPLQYLKHVGWANAEGSSGVRTEVETKVNRLFARMMQYISIDSAADEMGKQFMSDAMPTVPLKQEKLCMVYEDGDRMCNGKIYNRSEINLELKVRLLRYHCLRIIPEKGTEGTVRIYYSTDNAKYYHGEEQQYLIVDQSFAPAVICLLHSYPAFVEVNALPLENDVDKMQIVSDLWERGLLVTEQPVSLRAINML